MKIVDRTMKKTLTLNIQYVLRANGGGFYVRYLILHVRLFFETSFWEPSLNLRFYDFFRLKGFINF